MKNIKWLKEYYQKFLYNYVFYLFYNEEEDENSKNNDNEGSENEEDENENEEEDDESDEDEERESLESLEIQSEHQPKKIYNMKEEDNNINNNSFENTEINTDSNQIINNDSILKKNSFMIISSIQVLMSLL